MGLKITEQYIQEVIDHEGASLVGKILKRFEIIDDQVILKKTIKELVYEEYRHVRDLLIAGGRGLEQTVFNFKTREKV